MGTDTKQLTEKPKPTGGKTTTAAATDLDAMEAALPGFRQQKEKLASLLEQSAEADRELARTRSAIFHRQMTVASDIEKRAKAILDGGEDPGPTPGEQEFLYRMESRAQVLDAAVRSQRATVEQMHEEASAIVWGQQWASHRTLQEARLVALISFAAATVAQDKFLAGIKAQGVYGEAPNTIRFMPHVGDPADPYSPLAKFCAEAAAKGITSWARLTAAGLPNRTVIALQRWNADSQVQAEQERKEAEERRRHIEAVEAAERMALADEQEGRAWSLKRLIFG